MESRAGAERRRSSWHSSLSLSAAAACSCLPDAPTCRRTETYRDEQTKETDKRGLPQWQCHRFNHTGTHRASGQKKRERIRRHNHNRNRRLYQSIIKKAGEREGRRPGRRRKAGLEHTASNYARHVLLHSVRANTQSTSSTSMGAGCKRDLASEARAACILLLI